MKQKTIFTIIVCLVVTMMMAQETRYVDLGLPSGILWADQNEPGVYTFKETTEKYSGKEMPGMREFQELVDQCTWKWNGNGYTIIGANGDSIILPMESHGDCQGNMSKETTEGLYWSAEAYDELEGWGLYFSPDKVYTNMSFIKCMALPVRKIQHPAETFLIPDYDKIQSIGQKKYEALLQRFLQMDSTLSTTDLQTVYFGSAFYGYIPKRLDANKLDTIYNEQGDSAAIAFLDNHLLHSPLDMKALAYRFSLTNQETDIETAIRCSWKFTKILTAICSTGDADSPETAMHVVQIADEYTVINYVLQVQIEQQMLTASMCDMFDVITKSGRKKQIYFDVQLVLALEHEMFSATTKPFKFKYHKQSVE